MVTIVDTDGDVTKLVPWLLENGVDGVLPLERQAGVDAMALREQFPELLMVGHYDKMVMTKGEEAMRDRDVVVLTDTDPSARSPIRSQLRPRGFQMVFVDKDGVVKLRKPSPWSVREIGRSIDKTPLRQREIRERREGG